MLSDYECTLVNVNTGEYEDTCLKCLKGLNIKVRGNTSLQKRDDLENDIDDFYMDEEDKFDEFVPKVYQVEDE